MTVPLRQLIMVVLPDSPTAEGAGTVSEWEFPPTVTLTALAVPLRSPVDTVATGPRSTARR
jgi:hypothetical protein